MTVCYRHFNKAGLLRNKGRLLGNKEGLLENKEGLLENKEGLLRAKIANVQIAYNSKEGTEKRR